MGGINLPPEDLTSLGSKRIADPETLKVFCTLKARATSLLDRHGVRFMSGWAIPEEQAGGIIQGLIKIKDDFMHAKEDFLKDYDQSIQSWIDRHAKWGEIIRHSIVSPDYVRARIDFKWQLFKVMPLIEHEDKTAVLEAGLANEVTNLGSTLFRDIAKTADEIWRRVYLGRQEVTHKALSPLKTLQQKLIGLSFVEPHVAPVADIMETAFKQIPARGNINGSNLLLIQGLVCLLRDSDALISQAQAYMDGYGSSSVIDDLMRVGADQLEDGYEAISDASSETCLPITIEPQPVRSNTLQSHGLW